MKIATATLSQYSRQALRARNHRLSKCSMDAARAERKVIFDAFSKIGKFKKERIVKKKENR